MHTTNCSNQDNSNISVSVTEVNNFQITKIVEGVVFVNRDTEGYVDTLDNIVICETCLATLPEISVNYVEFE